MEEYDVYRFIRSKDIREYNKKIGHKFNTLESCFFVWRNTDIPLYDKHRRWEEICLSMPDMEIKERLNVDYAPSLYELIGQFVATDKYLINEFYREEDKAIYSYRFYCEGDSSWCEDFRTPYSTFEKMKQALEEDLHFPILAIEYKKNYLDSDGKEIVLSTKKDGTIMDVIARSWDYGDCRRIREKALVQKDYFFEGLWIDVPTPFKVGDIVCSKKTPFGYNIYSDSQPFVLTYLANWTTEMSKERGDDKDRDSFQDKRLQRWKESGDSTDMIAYGFFLDTDYHDRFTGRFYYECMHDYTDLEYYKGEFVGGERVLLPISYFLQGEISEETLVKSCDIIKKQEEVKKEIKYLGILDEWIKKLGVE